MAAPKKLREGPVRASQPDFAAVHARLKRILGKYQTGAFKGTDKPGNYTLIGPPTEKTKGKPMWLGAVTTQKNYVSYHFMPVYGCRDLLDDMSLPLKKHMQGKACFNFTTIDEPLFKELAALTECGYRRFKQLKYIE